MSLDARRVLLFRDVVRAGSISAAARELGWTQPAVSQQLQRLEREAGCPLLLRGARGVTPTEAGAALLVHADAVAGRLAAAGDEVADHARLRAGRVRLVAFPSAAAVLAPPAIEALSRAHAGVEVGLLEAEPPEAWTAVREGEADVALVFGHDGPPPDEGDLTWLPLLVEPLLLVLAPNHPAAEGRTSLARLAGEPWVAGCVRCRAHLVERCREAGFEPRLQHESDDYVVVQNLVARGLGVTLLPRTALEAFTHPGVVTRTAPGLGERHVGVVHRPGAEGTPAVRALLAELTALARAPRG